MKKFLITTILFMLALTVVAYEQSLYKLLDEVHMDLTVGIKQPETVDIADFSKPVSTAALTNVKQPTAYISSVDALYSGWYTHDFAETPFDGRLEILVMGEPLPTPVTTLLVAFMTVGIIYMNRNKWSKQEKTLG